MNKEKNKKENPFQTLDPFKKDIVKEINKIIVKIHDKEKLIEIQRSLTHKLNSM